jgi:NADPH:quinone reductase-like Zn-dependent oxidoreductase
MRAAVCVRAGGPEVLEIHEVPVPAVREGWSLVRVRGAGLNRSELRFHSDTVKGSAGTAVLQRVVHEVETGAYRPKIDRVVGLDDLAAAHRQMEANQATGKLVVVPRPRGQRPT